MSSFYLQLFQRTSIRKHVISDCWEKHILREVTTVGTKVLAKLYKYKP